MLQLALLVLCGAALAQLPIPQNFNPTVIDGQTEVFIGIKWDPNMPNSGVSPSSDFDLVMYHEEEDCTVYKKGSYGGLTCWGSEEGFAALGPFSAQWILNSGLTTFSQYDTSGTFPWDSTSSSGSGSGSSRAGMEGIIISGGLTGTFKIALYDYTNTGTGNFNRAQSVTGLRAKIFVGSTNVSALDINAPSTSCGGRFWNIATLVVTGTTPLAYTLTVTNTVTNTPLTTFGSTATRSFERGAPGTPNRPGTTATCGSS